MSDKKIATIKIDEIGRGAVKELFSSKVRDIVDNILNENTKPTADREITIKVLFRPTKDRNNVFVSGSVGAKLAPYHTEQIACVLNRDGLFFDMDQKSQDGEDNGQE